MMRADAGLHPDQSCLDLATRPFLPKHNRTTLIMLTTWNEFLAISMPATRLDPTRLPLADVDGVTMLEMIDELVRVAHDCSLPPFAEVKDG
jgi:hypothetical protein